MRKYLPQDHISIYEPLMKANYSVAISYYQQKRRIFETKFYSTLNVKFSEITKALNATLASEWQKKIEDLVNSLQSTPIDDGKRGYAYTTSNTYVAGMDPDVDRIVAYVSGRGAQGKASNPKAMLGTVFEPFVKSKILNNTNLDSAILNSIKENGSKILLELTGNKVSTSALVKGKKQIRPDVMMTFDSGFFWSDNNGILNSGIPPRAIELQSLIDLNLTDDTTLLSMMQDYLRSNTFGFNLKYWVNPSGKVFTRSEVLKNSLNKTFRQRHDGSYHSWEEEYATAYANYEVSRYLINLINPNVIAFVTGLEFYWVDTFLQSHLLRMRVQRAATTEKHKKLPFNSSRNGRATTETLPLIKSSEVYIQTLSSMKRTQLIQRNRSGGKVKINNKLSRKS